MITVKELINQLQKMPQDATLVVYGQVPSKHFSQDKTRVDAYVTGVKPDENDTSNDLIFITI